MKAWQVNGEDGYSVVVFAETRGKARVIAMGEDACEDMKFIDIKPYRLPIADHLYKNRCVMDWDNDEDRMFLVKECEWSCVDGFEDDCEYCKCREYCVKYQDELRYREMDILDEQ